ncbi:hypothetical protein Tco_0156851 [Tanacetum coccineum]
MIQPEPKGSTQGYPLDSVEVLRFYTLAGNPVKEILLKLNLPDHRSILTDSKFTPTKHGQMINPYSSPRFIANCFNAGYLKMEVKGLEVGSIWRIQGKGYGILEFLGVGTMFDIFQNILFPYIQYGVLVFTGYGVLIKFPSWSLVSAGTDTSYPP